MDVVFDADRFDELMLERGWAIADLWKAAIRKGEEISETSIRAWATRRWPPKLSNIRMLASVFEVDLQELIIRVAKTKVDAVQGGRHEGGS